MLVCIEKQVARANSMKEANVEHKNNIDKQVGDIREQLKVELVSKELNHFGGIASFFRDWAPGTLTGHGGA